MRGRGLGTGRHLVSRASRIRSSRRSATLLVGLALLASAMLRPEEVLADPNVIPSGAGTIVIGPQAMEGNLQIHSGDTLKAGFDFTMPGSHPAAQVTVENGSVRIAVRCSDGTTPPPIPLNLPTQTIGVTASSPAWYPSGNQSDPSVYQASLAAPDLCGGGVMSAAAGATFTATVSSTDTTDALNFRFHYSDNTSGSWSGTAHALPVPFAETLPSVQLTPSLGLTLAVDRASAVPGDMLTYTSSVSNTGVTLTLAGDLIASNTGSAATTVASYWDELATSLDAATWTPFAGAAASQSGYTPAVTPPIAAGMSLTFTPVAAGGVTYPGGGDLVLGTSIAPGSTALWHYTASLPLTPSQVGFLLNPGQVKRVRGSVHVEVNPPNPGVTQPAVMSVDFTQEFLGASPAPTGAVRNVTVSIQPPQGATPLQFGAADIPSLASIAPGASVTVSGASAVQAVAARTADESDAAYLQRLAATEGSILTASAQASGTGWSGPVSSSSPAPTASTNEHLPIVGIAKSGPVSAGAGTTASYPLTLTNGGGAPASGLAVTDSLPGGASGTVSGVPAGLAPGAGGTATASYAIPGSQPAGSLADTAAVTWQDANGNAYGPVSSSFTTTVTNTLSGATLTLAPQVAGPDVVGQSQQLTATLLDRGGSPVAGQGLTFSITGANPTTAPATTDAGGRATFSYVGAAAGTDLAQVTASAPGVNLQSNTASVSWVKPIQTVSMTPVQGNFFHEPSSATSFVARPGDTPDFSQTFPTIDFNPPAGTVPHDISGVTNQTRPFTDLTTDVNGNFDGTIVAQGGGLQAGVGTMSSFDAAFTGTLVAAEAGDVTFDLKVGDGFILGVGGGATRVSGDLTSPPASNTSVFQGYGLIAAYQAQSATATRTATVHFPAPGSYPFEIDYFDCCDGDLSLTMTAASIVPQTSPLSIYVGYADGLRPGGSAFPFPWIGSPGTTFVGDTNVTFDSGAIRFDNSSDSAITLDQVTVDVGPTHLDLWPRDLTVPAHQTLILAQTNGENFDTSDFPGIQCNGNDGIVPRVNVTVAGTVTSYPDTHQVLNTGGFDLACRGNESTAWQRIAGVTAAIDVPVPPAVALNLSPLSVPGATVGLAQQLTATAMDASGAPVAGLPLSVQVFGANAQQFTATTDASGLATFSYTGVSPGADQVQVSGFVTGFRAISNLASVTWANPLQPGPNPQPSGGPPPSVTGASPADGAVVTRPIPVDATITPPAGQSIASWQVTYQGQGQGQVVTLASGTGTPPSPLATFDPTLLPNDSYQINVTAVASNGVFETMTTTVTVFGDLKLGRYVTTYQDLNVPVNGFQMQVRRRYDSIDKAQGDFGVGWRVDVVNFRSAPNRVLGAGGWTMYDSACVFGLCLTAFKSSVPHYVSVTFPDQHTEIFDFTPSGGTNLFWTGGAAFTARSGTGTTSKLEAVGDGGLSYIGDGNLYSGGLPFSPQRFKLTTLDGRILVLDRTSGLVSETDRSGNSLSVDASGIHASNGQSVTFARDSAGRIVQVLGPTGQSLQYTYSAAGDLADSTDPNGSPTTYSYDSNHNLLKAVGSAQPAQTFQYDSSGRLSGITDANGNTTQVSTNVAGQQQTVIDPNGQLSTVYTYDDLGDVIRQDKVFGGQTLTTTATYDQVGRPLTRTDPLGHTWKGTYDANGDVLSFNTPLSNGVNLTYDSFGLPLNYTDALSSATKLGYDSNGNLTTYTNALGQVETYSYDAFGHRTSRTDALGNTWNYTYDSQGHNTSVTDPLGNKTSYTYDPNGRVTSSTDPLGNTTTNTYDALGNLTSSKDAAGSTTSYAYSSQGLLASRTDALGRATTYSYDANYRLSSETDPLGQSTAYTYDVDGRLASRTDPVGGVTTYAYDGAGRLTSQRDPVGNVTSFAYDSADRLVTRTMPNGGVYTYSYDNDGHQTSETDPLGHVAASTYDAAGHLVSTIDPLGNLTRYTVDALGRQTSVTDALGQTTSSAYDAAGHLLSTTDQLGNATVYGYDATGRRISATDPLGHTTVYAYDAAGRPASVTDALGRATNFSHDPVGRVTAAALPSGIKTTYGYDALGHQTSITDGLGNMTAYVYDAAGRQVSMTDARGSTTTYGYDAAGRQTSITDALAGKVEVSYDAAGHRTSVRNPRGDTVTFTFDALGNLATRTDPAGGTTADAYDAAGRLVRQVDPRGITVTHGYDDGNNLTRTGFPGGSLAFTYDALNRRTSMTDSHGTTSYTYDPVGRMTSVAAPEGSIGYTYDAAGNRTSMTLPGPRKVGYSYDALNQLTAITDWAGQSFGLGYDVDGRRTTIARPDGITTTYGYDSAGRMTSVDHDSGSGPVAHYSYRLDQDGNRVAMTSAAGTESYTLDALNRITGASYPGGDSASYSYDAAGNRTAYTLDGKTTNYAYDSAGRLTSAGGITFTYDAAGNITGSGSDTFSWDWAGRLSTSTVGGNTSSYTYDGDGIRVGAQMGSSSARYQWDRGSGLPTLVDDGQNGYVSSSGVLEQLPAGSTSAATYPLVDALGSVRGLANAAGAQVGGSSYDVFGQPRSSSGAQSVFGFTGQQVDASGLLFLRARYYNPDLGRFLSADNVQPNARGSQGFNLYSYVANDPVTFADPGGRFAELALQLTTIPSWVPYALAISAAVAAVLLAVVLALHLASEAALPAPWPNGEAGAGTGPRVDTDELAKQLLNDVGTLSRAAAIAAAAACAALVAASLLIDIGDGPCSGRKVPIFFSGTDNPETTENIFHAETVDRRPVVLNYSRARPRSVPPWEPWYDVTLACNETARSAYADNHDGDRGVCDEYPFNSTTQNHQDTASVSLRLVPTVEGVIQGNAIGAFYRECNVNDGGKFAVVPVQSEVDVPSFGWCPGRQ